MRTYQIIFSNGLTRNVEADGCIKTELKTVFFRQHGETLSFRGKTVMTVEEVCDFGAELPQVPKSLQGQEGGRCEL